MQHPPSWIYFLLSLLQCILGIAFILKATCFEICLKWSGRNPSGVFFAFVLLKMLSRFWNSTVVWSACLFASGLVRALWGVLLHLALFWMDLSQHVFWKSLVRVVVVLVLHRCLWYIGNLFCLSISLSLPVFPVVFSFVSTSFPLMLYIYFSLCLSHTTFLFFHSLPLVLFFLFLSLAIPFLFSPGNYSGSGNLSLSFLYSLSLVLFLSLCYCSGRWTGECYWRGREKRVSVRRDEMKGCNKISLFEMENGWVSQVCTWIMAMLIVYHYSHYKTAQ